MLLAYELPDPFSPIVVWSGAIVVFSTAVLVVYKTYRAIRRRVESHIRDVAIATVEEHEGDWHGPSGA